MVIPWDRLLVDLIGQYKIIRGGHNGPLILKDITIIDMETGWFQIIKYTDKQADTISNLVDTDIQTRAFH